LTDSDSLPFYEPPALSQSLNVLIRVSVKNPDNNRKPRVFYINNVNNDTTIGDLKQSALELSEISAADDRHLYYYGYELDNDNMPLLTSSFFKEFIDRKKLPLIFDFVVIQQQKTTHLPISTSFNKTHPAVAEDSDAPVIVQKIANVARHMGNNKRIPDDNYNDHVTERNDSKYAKFFRNYAIIYYIHLSIHIAIENQ
jgi:hypothetical protein